MKTGTWIANRNSNGKVVAHIQADIGGMVTVPKAGRNSDERVLLSCHDKPVEYEMGDGGTLLEARQGTMILFSSEPNPGVVHHQTSPSAAAQPAGNPPSHGGNAPGQHSMQTIAQQRASHALSKINDYKNKGGDKQKRFNSYVSSFGPMILMNGFGQACAFYLAKKDEHSEVLKMLEDWLKDDGQVFHGENSSLMECIVAHNASTYQLAQVEALAYLDWLKKFAKAFLKSDADNAKEADDAAAA